MSLRRRTARAAAAAAAALAVTLALAGCSDGDGPTPTSTSSDDAASAVPAWAPAILTDGEDRVVALDFTGTPAPSADLRVAVLSRGDGPDLAAGQTLTVDYLGQVYQGDEPFDASFQLEPIEVSIGVGSVIAGWDEGLVGVPIGSRVLLSIPPELGYGEAGSPPSIPGGASLFFVVDLIAAS